MHSVLLILSTMQTLMNILLAFAPYPYIMFSSSTLLRSQCWPTQLKSDIKKNLCIFWNFFYRDGSQTILRYDRHISFYVNKMFYFHHRHSLWKYFTSAYKVSFSKWYDMVCLTKLLFLLKQKTRAYDQPIY